MPEVAAPLVTQIDFLRLLTTQLQYQNPLDPLSNTEFLGQMAQFSNLQQIIDLNTNFASFTESWNTNFASLNTSLLKNQSLSLLGKQVDFIDPTTNVVLRGNVSGVKFVEGVPILTITHLQGTSEVGLDYITSVRA
ncbi:MAG: flagellar hook capping FlgD N-terminal domain-containing protein [bacterium]